VHQEQAPYDLHQLCQQALEYANSIILDSPNRTWYGQMRNLNKSAMKLTSSEIKEYIQQVGKKRFDALIDLKNKANIQEITYTDIISKLKQIRIGNCGDYSYLILDFFLKHKDLVLLNNIDVSYVELEYYELSIDKTKLPQIDHVVVLVRDKKESYIINGLFNEIYPEDEQHLKNIPATKSNKEICFIPFDKKKHFMALKMSLQDILLAVESEISKENVCFLKNPGKSGWLGCLFGGIVGAAVSISYFNA
jgi:ADP-heptose:LPS heptosyltransferase